MHIADLRKAVPETLEAFPSREFSRFYILFSLRSSTQLLHLFSSLLFFSLFFFFFSTFFLVLFLNFLYTFRKSRYYSSLLLFLRSHEDARARPTFTYTCIRIYNMYKRTSALFRNFLSTPGFTASSLASSAHQAVILNLLLRLPLKSLCSFFSHVLSHTYIHIHKQYTHTHT